MPTRGTTSPWSGVPCRTTRVTVQSRRHPGSRRRTSRRARLCRFGRRCRVECTRSAVAQRCHGRAAARRTDRALAPAPRAPGTGRGCLVRVRPPLWSSRSSKPATERPFDAVHAHDLNTLALAASLAGRWGVPYVYDAHELWSDRGLPGRPTPLRIAPPDPERGIPGPRRGGRPDRQRRHRRRAVGDAGLERVLVVRNSFPLRASPTPAARVSCEHWSTPGGSGRVATCTHSSPRHSTSACRGSVWSAPPTRTSPPAAPAARRGARPTGTARRGGRALPPCAVPPPSRCEPAPATTTSPCPTSCSTRCGPAFRWSPPTSPSCGGWSSSTTSASCTRRVTPTSLADATGRLVARYRELLRLASPPPATSSRGSTTAGCSTDVYADIWRAEQRAVSGRAASRWWSPTASTATRGSSASPGPPPTADGTCSSSGGARTAAVHREDARRCRRDPGAGAGGAGPRWAAAASTRRDRARLGEPGPCGRLGRPSPHGTGWPVTVRPLLGHGAWRLADPWVQDLELAIAPVSRSSSPTWCTRTTGTRSRSPPAAPRPSRTRAPDALGAGRARVRGRDRRPGGGRPARPRPPGDGGRPAVGVHLRGRRRPDRLRASSRACWRPTTAFRSAPRSCSTPRTATARAAPPSAPTPPTARSLLSGRVSGSLPAYPCSCTSEAARPRAEWRQQSTRCSTCRGTTRARGVARRHRRRRTAREGVAGGDGRPRAPGRLRRLPPGDGAAARRGHRAGAAAAPSEPRDLARHQVPGVPARRAPGRGLAGARDGGVHA